LSELARSTGHPETAHLPWLLWGASRRGSTVHLLTCLAPDRVVGCIPYNSYLGDILPEEFRKRLASGELVQPALVVPLMRITGDRDMDHMGQNCPVAHRGERDRGGLRTYLTLFNSEHGSPVKCHDMILTWMADVLAIRVPADWDPREGRPKLKSVRENDGWIGGPDGSIAKAYGPATKDTSWLPGENSARVWRKWRCLEREPGAEILSTHPACKSLADPGNRIQRWFMRRALDMGNGTRHDLAVWTIWANGRCLRASAEARTFNRAPHLADGSGLSVAGGVVTGTLGVIVQPDQWVPPDHKTIECVFEVKVPFSVGEDVKPGFSGRVMRRESSGKIDSALFRVREGPAHLRVVLERETPKLSRLQLSLGLREDQLLWWEAGDEDEKLLELSEFSLRDGGLKARIKMQRAGQPWELALNGVVAVYHVAGSYVYRPLSRAAGEAKPETSSFMGSAWYRKAAFETE
jgi:hypothetical protein